MIIPRDVLDGAWSGQEVGRGAGATGVERLLTAIAEQALHHGAKVGLNALVEAVVGLTGTSGAAFHTCDFRVALQGREPPAPGPGLHPWQCYRAGRAVLVLGEPCQDAILRRHLSRLTELGDALLSALAREEAARDGQKRLRQERLQLQELVAHRDRGWSRAAHDLRTPLLVLQGYVEMMMKGMAGELSPPMKRYLERMRQSAGDLNTRLQHRQRGSAAPAGDARPLLSAAFGPGRPCAARMELPEEPMRLRVNRSVMTPLVRSLERLLTGTGTTETRLQVDMPEGTQVWRWRIHARNVRPPLPRARETLERFVRRAEGQVSVEESETGLELTVLLPRIIE
ncbi:MAG: histidine kinase dimerization/phospho-acceptor domain-containing protein [Cystobacter sp.]